MLQLFLVMNGLLLGLQLEEINSRGGGGAAVQEASAPTANLRLGHLAVNNFHKGRK